MNYAAALNPKPAPLPQTKPYLRLGWVNLSDPAYRSEPKPKPVDMDARLKEAAATMKRRWDAWNEAHGVEYDYDPEPEWSETDSDDREAEEGEDAWDDDHFFNEYSSKKKLS